MIRVVVLQKVTIGMSGVSLPVTRPIGRALVVANPSGRAQLVELLKKLGFDCGECDDPYTATLELARRRLGFRALILSLAGLYHEELSLIATVKRRFPHLEIWLAHTDGRQGSLAECMRFGADGLLDDEGLHRIAALPASDAVYQPVAQSSPMVPFQQSPPQEILDDEPIESPLDPIGEPVLTAEELRALLQDQPAMPPSGGEERG
jgi:hypothetical protein